MVDIVDNSFRKKQGFYEKIGESLIIEQEIRDALEDIEAEHNIMIDCYFQFCGD